MFGFFAQWAYNLRRQPEKYVSSGENLDRLIAEAYGSEPYYGRYRRMMMKRRLRAAAGRLLRRG